LLHSSDIEHPASAATNPRIDNIAKRIVTSPDESPVLLHVAAAGFLAGRHFRQ